MSLHPAAGFGALEESGTRRPRTYSECSGSGINLLKGFVFFPRLVGQDLGPPTRSKLARPTHPLSCADQSAGSFVCEHIYIYI